MPLGLERIPEDRVYHVEKTFPIIFSCGIYKNLEYIKIIVLNPNKQTNCKITPQQVESLLLSKIKVLRGRISGVLSSMSVETLFAFQCYSQLSVASSQIWTWWFKKKKANWVILSSRRFLLNKCLKVTAVARKLRNNGVGFRTRKKGKRKLPLYFLWFEHNIVHVYCPD